MVFRVPMVQIYLVYNARMEHKKYAPGWFEIDGTKEVCSKGELVVIPAGRKFTYKGKLTLLLIDTPPWREDQEETV